MKTKVAIVGGGLAGLSSAAHLLLAAAEQYEIHVFESAAMLGGQCASWLDAKGRPVETGIHLDFPWYHNKDALFAAIGHPLPLKETDGNYYVCNGQTGQIDTLLAGKSVLKTLRGLATFPGLTPTERLQLIGFIFRLMRMDDRVADSFDHLSVTQFLLDQKLSAGIRQQLALEAVTIQGLRAEESSAASFIKFLRTMYGSMGIFDTTFFGAPLSVALVDPLADFITRHGGQIHLATAIKRVTPATAGPARITTTAGVTHEADHVIFAVPGYAVPALLPAELRTTSPFAALADLKETPIITITLWYATKVFTDGNVYISPRDREHGPIFDAVADKAFHWKDWPKLKAEGSIIQVLIDAADDVLHLSDAEILAKVSQDLARFFPHCRGQAPIDATVLRLKNTYCGTRVGYWSKVPRKHQTGLPGVWLAGDYTAGVYHYGMESAVISGKAVANELLREINHAGFEILRPRYLPFVRV